MKRNQDLKIWEILNLYRWQKILKKLLPRV